MRLEGWVWLVVSVVDRLEHLIKRPQPVSYCVYIPCMPAAHQPNQSPACSQYLSLRVNVLLVLEQRNTNTGVFDIPKHLVSPTA